MGIVIIINLNYFYYVYKNTVLMVGGWGGQEDLEPNNLEIKLRSFFFCSRRFSSKWAVKISRARFLVSSFFCAACWAP